MKPASFLSLVIAVAFFSGGTGYLVWQAMNPPPPPPPDVSRMGLSEVTGQTRPDFSLPDLEGRLRSVQEWQGKVLVVNFWATWCPPCRREIPAFIALQEEFGDRGLQFLGVAIDETAKVQDYVDQMAVNYPVLTGQLNAIEIGKQYGNQMGALPYTVVVDTQGVIRFVRRGELTRGKALEVLEPLLNPPSA